MIQFYSINFALIDLLIFRPILQNIDQLLAYVIARYSVRIQNTVGEARVRNRLLESSESQERSSFKVCIVYCFFLIFSFFSKNMVITFEFLIIIFEVDKKCDKYCRKCKKSKTKLHENWRKDHENSLKKEIFEVEIGNVSNCE